MRADSPVSLCVLSDASAEFCSTSPVTHSALNCQLAAAAMIDQHRNRGIAGNERFERHRAMRGGSARWRRGVAACTERHHCILSNAANVRVESCLQPTPDSRRRVEFTAHRAHSRLGPAHRRTNRTKNQTPRSAPLPVRHSPAEQHEQMRRRADRKCFRLSETVE
jgi:hypothetical protein